MKKSHASLELLIITILSILYSMYYTQLLLIYPSIIILYSASRIASNLEPSTCRFSHVITPLSLCVSNAMRDALIKSNSSYMVSVYMLIISTLFYLFSINLDRRYKTINKSCS